MAVSVPYMVIIPIYPRLIAADRSQSGMIPFTQEA
jgi:hypothetical protein